MKPDTILAWHRRLIAKKFDGSANRDYPGRPRTDREIEDLIVRVAKENRSRGYDRIAGALAAMGREVSDQTVGNVLKRNGLTPAPLRSKGTTWKEFIRSHMDLLAVHSQANVAHATRPGRPGADSVVTAIIVRRTETGIQEKMSRKVSGLLVSPASIAGVRSSLPSFKARCGRAKL